MNASCDIVPAECVFSHSMSSHVGTGDPLQCSTGNNNVMESEEIEVLSSNSESPEKSRYIEVIIEEGRCSAEKELQSVDANRIDSLNEEVNKRVSQISTVHVDETSLTEAVSCLVVSDEEAGDTTSVCDISDPLGTELMIEPAVSPAQIADELEKRNDEDDVEVSPSILINCGDMHNIQVDDQQERVKTPTAEDLDMVTCDVPQADQVERIEKRSKPAEKRKPGKGAKSKEKLLSKKSQKALKITKNIPRRGRLTRLASKSSSTTETSSETEAQIRLQDEKMRKEAERVEETSDSTSENKNDHAVLEDDDDDDSVTNEITEPKRKTKYRTRLGRKKLARFRAEMAENTARVSKSSDNSEISTLDLPAGSMDDALVPTVSRSTPADSEIPLVKMIMERRSPPDLGPPILSPITSEKESMLEEKIRDESGIISSTDNSFEVPQSSSAEELPDIEDVPLPAPSSLETVNTENGATVIVPTSTAESTNKSTPVETSTMPAIEPGDTGKNSDDLFRDVIRKTNAPAGVKKNPYTVEHRNYLYRDGAFVAEREDLGLEGSIFLWRILKKENKLQKFVPVLIDNKECHYGASIFLPLETMDEEFYSKYQPVLFDLLGNREDFVIGMHYSIPRCIPVLGYFPFSDHLHEYFQYFLKFVTIRAMTDHDKLPTEGKIRARVGPEVNSAVEAVENHIAKTIEGIMFRNQWPRDVVYCLLEYPHLVLTTIGVKKDVECEPCKRLGMQGVAAFKLAFHGKCYDPDTLAVVDKDGAAWPDYQYCYSCPQSLKSLHRLVHYKYWVFMAVRSQLPGQKLKSQEVFDYITKDFVWTKRMFYEFQTIVGEGLQAKDRTDRLEKNQVNRVKAATKEKRPPGRPPGFTPGPSKKNLARKSESSAISSKPISVASQQEREMPNIELCNYEDIAALPTTNSNEAEVANHTDLFP